METSSPAHIRADALFFNLLQLHGTATQVLKIYLECWPCARALGNTASAPAGITASRGLWVPEGCPSGTRAPWAGTKSGTDSGRKVFMGSCHPPQKLEKGCFCTTEVPQREKGPRADGSRGLTTHQPLVALVYLLRLVFQSSQGKLPVVHFWPFSR